ncbi:unnamed protein product [Caenorhabditis nigoni]
MTSIKSGEFMEAIGALKRKGTWTENRRQYMVNKSKELTMPNAKEAEINPKFIFTNNEPIILDVCFECVNLNRKLSAEDVDEQHQKISLVLCRICRANWNSQRRNRFFKYDMLCFKREYDAKMKNAEKLLEETVASK